MPNVIESFFLPLRGSFLVPQGCDPAAFGHDLAEMLDGYTEHQLSQAVRYIKETREMRTFPTIAECRKACERFAPTAGAQRAAYQTDEEKRSEAIRRRLREKDAAALCRSLPIALEAQREGWLQTLLEFAEDHLRAPSEYDVRRLRATSAAVDENLHREPRPATYEALCALRAAMKARAAERVWGAPERAAPTGELVTGRAALPQPQQSRSGDAPVGMTEAEMHAWYLEKLKGMADAVGRTLTDADIARLPNAPPPAA